MMSRRVAGPLFLLFGFAAAEAAEESLTLVPDHIRLAGREARQKLLVERTRDGVAVGEAAGEIDWSSSDPDVVRVEGGVAVPVGDGAATITARVGDAAASADVHVAGLGAEFEWSFRNHVQSVLTRMGCNSGACHGALAGKKGFRLSLRGYDAQGDFDALVRQAQGRRICPDQPARSLLLLKATASVPHGGGKRFDVDSPEYRVLVDWIASGLTPPADDERRIDHIEVSPPHVQLTSDATQSFLVRAVFSDGSVEDVTRWVKFASTNAEVADVDESGRVRVLGRGEAAVTAWYLAKIGLATITVPYDQSVDPAAFSNAERRNFIDEIVLEKLRELNLPPSPPASDEEFLRRAMLDAIGVPPTVEEVRRFLADDGADKRDRLIESLLARPEFVDYWTYKWSDLFLVNSERLRPPAMWAYYHWVREQVAANRPWDQTARDLLTAQGATLENGAANFYVLHQDPRELAETISVAFLGLSINCARCHNHPLERWTNDEYFGFANLVSRVRLKNARGDGNFLVFAAREGDLVQPLRGRPQPPRPLDGQALPLDSPEDRRTALADWATSPDNPYFTRVIANRIWANFMGVGVVEPVDDLRLTNPPSNPKLLNALADHLRGNRYDVKALMRTILQSAAYQRSSEPTAENAGDERFYSRYYPRRLMAEVLYDAIAQVTGVPTQFEGYPAGWRAIQLPDSKVASYFLERFGRPKRDITCECERTNAPNMVQALHIANGDSLNQKLREPGGNVEKLLEAGHGSDRLVEEIYLLALARRPTPSELEALGAELSATPTSERRAFVEDLMWSLLSSKEFLFNH